MLWLKRLQVALASLKCPEAWVLQTRVGYALLKALQASRPATAATGTFIHVNCPPVGSIGFRRYLRGLRRMARGEHLPLVAHVAVTSRCVNQCTRCSNVAKASADPSLEQLKHIFSSLRQAGTACVALTGGEPLLRGDLPEIIRLCADMAPTLFTTGHGLDDPKTAALRSAGLAAAFVSLDHFSRAAHDNIRGREDAFDEAERAIKRLLRNGIYTAAQAVVDASLLSAGELEKFFEFCQTLQVHEVMLLELVPVNPRSNGIVLKPEDRRLLAEWHKRSARDLRLPKISSMSFLESPEFFGCQAGYGFLYISATGDVFPCDFMPLSFGNVFADDYGQIMERLAKAFPVPCESCRVLDLHDSIRNETLPISRPRAEQLLACRHNSNLPALSRWIIPRHRRPSA